MRSASVLILLAALMAFSTGLVLAEDALNDTNVTTSSNITNITSIAEPMEIVSKYKQLSTYAQEPALILGKNIAQEYSDVTMTADRQSVFSRGIGTSTPAVRVIISKVNAAGDKFVEVANKAVGSWDLTGWMLASAGSVTYIFPEFALEDDQSVRVHEGNGISTKTDLYTNSTTPLWIDSMVSLQNSEGNTISKYDLVSIPEKTTPSDPLASQIQY